MPGSSGRNSKANTAVADLTYREMFRRALREVVAFVVFFAVDTFRAMSVIFALYVASLMLQLGKLAGLEGRYVYLLEWLDFWLHFGAYSLLSVWFLVKLGRWMWREFRES